MSGASLRAGAPSHPIRRGRTAWLAGAAACLALSCDLGTPIGGDHRTGEDIRRERLQERIGRGEHGEIAPADSLVIRRLLDSNGLGSAQVRDRAYADETGKVFAVVLDGAGADTLRFPPGTDSVPVEWLYARTGAFTGISRGIVGIPSLTQLDFSGHRMTQAPAFIFELPLLRSAAFSHGQLRHWDPDFVDKAARTRKLVSVSLLDNEIPTLPPGHGKWNRKVALVLDRNRLCALTAPEITFLNSSPGVISWSYQRCEGFD